MGSIVHPARMRCDRKRIYLGVSVGNNYGQAGASDNVRYAARQTGPRHPTPSLLDADVSQLARSGAKGGLLPVPIARMIERLSHVTVGRYSCARPAPRGECPSMRRACVRSMSVR
jgi:hypothetical protein